MFLLFAGQRGKTSLRACHRGCQPYAAAQPIIDQHQGQQQRRAAEVMRHRHQQRQMEYHVADAQADLHRQRQQQQTGQPCLAIALELPGQQQEFVFTDVWYAGFSGLSAGKFDDAFWQQLLQVRDEVNKVLEAARREEKIGASLQAEVTLYASAALAADLAKLGDELRFVLITSTAQVSTDAAPADAVQTELAGLRVQVAASTAAKCGRCWHHRHDVGANAAHAELCLRCVSNVEGAGEQRAFA